MVIITPVSEACFLPMKYIYIVPVFVILVFFTISSILQCMCSEYASSFSVCLCPGPFDIVYFLQWLEDHSSPYSYPTPPRLPKPNNLTASYPYNSTGFLLTLALFFVNQHAHPPHHSKRCLRRTNSVRSRARMRLIYYLETRTGACASLGPDGPLPLTTAGLLLTTAGLLLTTTGLLLTTTGFLLTTTGLLLTTTGLLLKTTRILLTTTGCLLTTRILLTTTRILLTTAGLLLTTVGQTRHT